MILTEPLASISGRVLLVPPSESDDALFAALRCHPETRRYIPSIPQHYTPEEARERRLAFEADKARLNFSIYAVTPGSQPKYVGAVGIFNIDEASKSCEMGISIWPDSYRAGFATEAMHTLLTHAFEERRLHRVVYHTAAHNVRMRGWLERFGATLEGTLRDNRPDGKGGYQDDCLYSILEHEWIQTVKPKMEEQIRRVIC
ncbi:Ribosomal-protein-alanine acetyltransferase [Mycena venus]|uniref:Ribosomal-protein-alanine acetyltransferase n=1 Tax=Mycena venus TaxID=2733690 RepID=A0A8H7D3K9_9AGAR|nr:Ribosomal-protein-alanine acetyltransferase [Mycena venus]